ncbi:MAG: hypothetical protein KJ886_03645 [Candidatus Thermoplasmatota archaeon]|nr:hypothetical protein [Candidatus Thermoplasmatota archaeon]MCG2736678.1 hypothetical protein [Candidatus Methanoperedenaceae archaeon]MCG2827007.1 hypothetical protein [Thermoplasmatales archaeon]
MEKNIASLNTILKGLKSTSEDSIKVFLKEVYNRFFKDEKDVTLESFEKSLLKLSYESRKTFLNACTLIHYSEKIKTMCKEVDEAIPNIKTLFLFIAVEAIMSISYPDLGSTRKVTSFFKEYLNNESKKDIVKSYYVRKDLTKVLNADLKGYQRMCFSKDCFYRNVLMHSSMMSVFTKELRKLDKTQREDLVKTRDDCDCILPFEEYLSKLGEDKKERIFNKVNDNIISLKKCRLETDELNIVLRQVITEWYGYFRCRFVHSGMQGYTAESIGFLKSAGVFDYYKNRHILIKICFKELKSIVVNGVIKYYKRNIEKIGTDKRIGIFAYGSLINDAGSDITPHIVEKMDQDSPKPVEHARSSSSRCGAPTLVFYDKGSIVKGKILILDLDNSEKNIEKVKEWLRKREGNTQPKYIKIMQMNNFETVLYCNIPPNVNQVISDKLSELAIESVKKCKADGVPENNGIRYLIESINNNIITPLTKDYMNKILQKTNSSTLEEAEKKLSGD